VEVLDLAQIILCFSTVSAGKYHDSTSVRSRLLPSSPVPVRYLPITTLDT